MTPRGWAWLGALCMALLAGTAFTVRFLRKPVQRPVPAAPSAFQIPVDQEPEAAQGPVPPPGPLRLHGSVMDGDGQPMPGAQVFLARLAHAAPPLRGCPAPAACEAPLDEVPVPALLGALHAGTLSGEAERDARTDAEGRYAFEPGGEGPWVAWVDEAAGFAAELLSRETAVEARALVLAPLRKVAGVVADEDERPVVGAHVHLVTELPRRVRTAVTGEDGSFTLEGPEEGLTVLVDAPGYAAQRTGSSGDDMHVVLRTEARCQVRVVRDGRPVDARVRVTWLSGEGPEQIHGAPGGRLLLELHEGARIALEGEDGQGRSAPVRLEATPRDCKATLSLRPAWPVPVRVVGISGAPVQGAQARAMAAAEERMFEGETDAEGWVVLGPLTAGAWELYAEHAGARKELTVQVAGAGQEVTLALLPERPRCTVTGTVVAPVGRELPEDFRYRAGDETGTAVLEGAAFSLEVPCGEFQLEASLDGLGEAAWRGKAPARGVRLEPVPPPGATVSVRAGGAPLPGAEVKLQRERSPGAPGGQPRLQRTAEDGLARFEGLPPGGYTLTVSAPGHAPFGPQRMEVEGGTTSVDVEFRRAPPR